MFSSVSWPAFVEFIFTVLFFYYAAVLILFYRLELSGVLTKFTSLKKDKQQFQNTSTAVTSNENKKAANPNSVTSLPSQKDQDKITISDNDISNIYLELEEAIVIAKEKKYARQELLTSLKLIVSKCANCAGTDLSKTINTQIQSHLNINSLEALDIQEFSQIWSK